MSDTSNLIEIGRILKPFGVKGDLKARFYIDDVSDLKNVKELYVKDKREPSGYRVLTVSSLKFDDNNPEFAKIVFAEILDRTQAEAWRLIPLFIPSENLNIPQDGEYFIKDLLDLSAIYQDEVIGKVINVIFVGDQNIFVIKMANSKSDLAIPFVDRYVEEIDLESQKVCFQNLAELM